MALSMTLIMLDKKHDLPATFYASVSQYLAPVQYIIDFPIYGWNWLKVHSVSRTQLQEQNEEFRKQLFVQQAQLQQLYGLYRENLELRRLLNAAPRINGHFMSAELLSVNVDPMVQHVLLNRGKKDGVFVGQPVLDAYGIMGQVISVGTDVSRVMLLSDRASAVPVQVYRNGLRGIVNGTGSPNGLELSYMPANSDLRVGDWLLASNLGLRYPAGYPVGIIKKIQRSREQTFVKVSVAPIAGLNRSQTVILAWINHSITLPLITPEVIPAANDPAHAALKPAEPSRETQTPIVSTESNSLPTPAAVQTANGASVAATTITATGSVVANTHVTTKSVPKAIATPVTLPAAEDTVVKKNIVNGNNQSKNIIHPVQKATAKVVAAQPEQSNPDAEVDE